MRTIVVALCLLAGWSGAFAQQVYPNKPVRLVVPFAPGASTDILARLAADELAKRLGQPFVVENVGGAGGTIGVARLARSAPDGYTIDIGQWDTHVGAIIYPLNYDLQKDFAPIGLLSVNPQLMIARKGFPADDLKGLLAHMKANPGMVTFVDQNAAARVTGVLMQQSTGTTVNFIPFRGAGPAMQAMLGGQVDLMVVQAAVTLPQARAGTVKILANLSPARSSVIPNIPTSEESGIPGLYASGWFGLFGPRGLPKEVLAKLNDAMVKGLADPKVRERFTDLGLDVASREHQSAEGLAAFHKAEIDKWWPIIRAANIKTD
jgi:tripartite-type tricarboxylate transporter receptor subunit TctC